MVTKIGLCLVVFLFCAQAVDYGLHGDHWALEGFVEDIKREVKPHERIFMEDLSGRLALLSQRRFVSGDGLVNSNAYLHDYLKQGRIGDYLRILPIDYFLTSNIQCYPYRKRMPWVHDVVRTMNDEYLVVIDLHNYLTKMPMKPSIILFPADHLVFDKCVNGFRELLFRVQ